MQQANVSPAATRKPGRPRSAEAEAAILDATLHLLAETMSVDQLSMEAIAARAGVGKATIYRRWPNKEALVVDAIKRRVHPEFEDVEGALARLYALSSREALISLLEGMRKHMLNQQAGGVYTVLMRESRAKSQLWARYSTQVIEPSRDLFRQVLRRGRETGELRPDLDVERAMLMLTSTMIFATRMSTPDASADAPGPTSDYCVGLVDDFLRGGSSRAGCGGHKPED